MLFYNQGIVVKRQNEILTFDKITPISKKAARFIVKAARQNRLSFALFL